MTNRINHTIRYLWNEIYELPLLIKANNTKLKILNAVDSALVVQPPLYNVPHDAAVRVHQKGNEQRLIWFDFMALLETNSPEASWPGTEPMTKTWYGTQAPSFYIICFPKATDYVAVIPHCVAEKHDQFWFGDVSIPGPFLPYVLSVDMVPEALERISKVGQGSKYRNPGTEVLLERWVPVLEPLSSLPKMGLRAEETRMETAQTQVAQTEAAHTEAPRREAAAPSLAPLSSRAAGKKRRRSSPDLEAPNLPPALRRMKPYKPTPQVSTAVVQHVPTAAFQHGSSRQQRSLAPKASSSSLQQGYMAGQSSASAPQEDITDIWQEDWLNNQQELVGYTEPTIPQARGIPGQDNLDASGRRENITLTGAQSSSNQGNLNPIPPQKKRTSGIWAGFEMSEIEDPLPVMPEVASRQRYLGLNTNFPAVGPVYKDFFAGSVVWDPTRALPEQQLQPQQLYLPGAGQRMETVPVEAVRLATSTTMGPTRPSPKFILPKGAPLPKATEPTPEPEEQPWFLLELAQDHPWGNHIYIPPSPAPTSILKVLLQPKTHCLVILTSYTTIHGTKNPTPLSKLKTSHPCLHLLKTGQDPEAQKPIYMLSSRDVESYSSHLNALKQSTLRDETNSRSGLRGRNRRLTEFPSVEDVLNWVEPQELQDEDLGHLLQLRFGVEGKRTAPRGTLPGEKFSAVVEIGEVLQAQVDVLEVWGRGDGEAGVVGGDEEVGVAEE